MSLVEWVVMAGMLCCFLGGFWLLLAWHKKNPTAADNMMEGLYDAVHDRFDQLEQKYLKQFTQRSDEMKLNIEVDTDKKTAVLLDDGAVPIAPLGPKLLPYDYNGAPTFTNGICVADWWMVGKTGCKKGALYNHWQIYNMTVTTWLKVTEFDVVCAPDPTNPVEMNPSNYNSCVHHAWEPVVGWVDPAMLPPGIITPVEVTDEIRNGWKKWNDDFRRARGIPIPA